MGPQRFRERLQISAPHLDTACTHSRPELLGQLGFDGSTAPSRRLGQTEEAGPRHWVPGQELGQQQVANPVAWKHEIGVGWIVEWCKSGGRHLSSQLGTGQVEQRPRYLAEQRRDSREPLDAAAMEQPQQNGFDLIVGVVTGEDIAGTELPALGFQLRVTEATTGLLEALPRGSLSWNLESGRGERHPYLLAQLLRGLGPPAGGRVEPMIEVERVEVDPPVKTKLRGSPEQGGGVGSTGEGDQQAITSTDGRGGAEEAPKGFEDSHDRRRVVAVKGLEPPT